MAKLYPPYIEGTLPAFCLNSNGDGEMVIPFAFNRAVSKNDVDSIMAKIKTVQNDILLGDVECKSWDNNEVTFTVTSNKLGKIDIKQGQFYKVQLAFKNGNEIGYYSTVGVIKCTSEPKVYIKANGEELRIEDEKGKSAVNNNTNEYMGIFEQNVGGDVTEKVYSSKFIITDLAGNEIANTGDVLHNVENNPDSYISYDLMKFNRDLEFGQIYRIKYEVTTNNGLVFSSPEYLLTQQKSLNMFLKGSLIADLNYEEGYVDISIKGYVDENGIEEIGNGAFLLSREDSLNPGVWEELGRFSLKYESPTKTVFRDFTIEQGKTYTYSIQQYNVYGIYSERKKSNLVYADFEDMFLFDGERQLKLRFNPQISSFKTQLAETRSETIGSKYPFFFRNARVGYKTFPISGLISMESDNNQFFTSFKDILKENWDTERHNVNSDKKLNPDIYSHTAFRNSDAMLRTNKKSQNITSERLFKIEVLDWFNNGRVKLFKSPGEGNYLVRLMDTSLSPENALGRMLHNVSSTAYECADCVYDKMVEYGIIEDTSKNENADGRVTAINWRVESLMQEEEVAVEPTRMLLRAAANEETKTKKELMPVYYESNLLKSDDENPWTNIIRFTEMIPGMQVELVFNPNGEFVDPNSGIEQSPQTYEIITIGSTGNYYADEITPVYGIYLINPNPRYELNEETQEMEKVPERIPMELSSGTITYQYETSVRSEFNLVSKAEIDIGAYKQFIGETTDVVTALETTRDQVSQIAMSYWYARPVEYLYYNGEKFETILTEWCDKNGEHGRRSNYSSPCDNLYWDSSFRDDEKFNDEESMHYSPFGLYVIRNRIDASSVPVAEIMKKYYIDRIYSAMTAQDALTEMTLAWQRASAITDEEEKAQLQDILDDTMYVLDAWTGDLYKVGSDFQYKPSITYNGEEIDLREILRYNIDGVAGDSTKLAVGNGAYGEVYYQKVTTSYQVEEIDSNLQKLKLDWTYAENAAIAEKHTEGEETANKAADEIYAAYNAALKTAIDNWMVKE